MYGAGRFCDHDGHAANRHEQNPREADDPSIPSSPTPSSPRLWLVVLIACAGQFLVVLDVSVVNVALPSMRTDLGLTASGLQWVVNAYSIAFAGFMLLGGRAADLFGRRRMFVVGLGLFTLASVAGGLAQEGWQLLAARAVQGLGAAVLSPSTLTLLTAAVPVGPARTRAVGTWTAVGAAGGAAGGFVGGVLVDLLSWRWVLLINVPIGALVLLCACLWLTESRVAEARNRLDLPGAVLVTGGLATLAYGIVQTEESGWGSPTTLLPLTGGLLLLATFVAWETRAKAPLMPLRIFRTRAVSAANATMALCASTTFGMWFFMTVYAQNVLGYTPSRRASPWSPARPASSSAPNSPPPPPALRRPNGRGDGHPDRGVGLRVAVDDDPRRHVRAVDPDPRHADDVRHRHRLDPAGHPGHHERPALRSGSGFGPHQHLPHDGRRPGPLDPLHRRSRLDHRHPDPGLPHRGLRGGVPGGRVRAGGDGGADGGVAAGTGAEGLTYSHPCCRAARTASIRLRVPVFPMAEDR